MKIKTEQLQITWKMIRRPYSYMRTPVAYCTYIAENETHKHRLRTEKGSKLFQLLESTTISKNPKYSCAVYVDGNYCGDKLISITNPRKL